MAIIKCKMCGRYIDVNQDLADGTCDSCGSTMTLSKVSDDQRANMLNRGNDFRRQTIVKQVSSEATSGNAAPLFMRAELFLEDGDFESANEYYDRILDMDPKCAAAYLGKLCAELHVCTKDELKRCAESFESSNNYRKAIRFADEAFKTELESYVEAVLRNKEDSINEAHKIVNIYTSQMESTSIIAEISTLEATIHNAEKQLINVEQQIAAIDREDFPAQDKELSVTAQKLKQDISKYTSQIGGLEKERSRFGVSDGKKKKEITQLIAELEVKCLSLKNELNTLDKLDNLIREKQRIIAGLENNRSKKIVMVNRAAELAGARSVTRKEYLAAMALLIKAGLKYPILFWETVSPRALSAGGFYTVGLKSDGTAMAVGRNDGGEIKVNHWADIVAISTGYYHTVGLKSDGTVVAVGENREGRCDVDGWKDIVSVTAGNYHTVGLKSDGFVVATGASFDNEGRYIGQCDVHGWFNIVSVSAGYEHTVGLKSDGTVLAVGDKKFGQCNVASWRDIVAISAGMFSTVGLKSDGTIVAVGYNKYGECNVAGWRDIVAIAAGTDYTVGLKQDGTVVAVGNNEHGQCDVASWRNIVAISSRHSHTVGLKADGTVVAVGNNKYGQCDLHVWSGIKVPER